ncbi:MAG: c-type cytochrome [Pseudomonadota bacterium]
MRTGILAIALCAAAASPLGAAEIAAPYTITNGSRIDDPIAGLTGDWQRGRTLFFDQNLTGCSACHGSPGGPGAETFDGSEEAPSLDGIAGRMSVGEIRLWIVAPETIDPNAAMPGFFLAGQRTEAGSPLINGPWLSAQQVEDIVAYLARQKTP